MIPILATLRALLTGLPWRLIGAVALVVLVALVGWRVSAWHRAYQRLEVVEAELEAERECRAGTRCAVRLDRLATDGAAAVEAARKAAQEAAERAQAERDLRERAALDRATAAATEAQARQRAAEARLRAALAEPTCARQAAEVIQCDY